MKRFTGKGFVGMNDSLDASLIGDNEVSTCSNCRINDDLSIEKRKGYYKALTGETNPILDITQIKLAETAYTLYGTKSDIKLLGSGAGTSVLSGLSGVDEGQFLNFNDKMFFANKANEIKKISLQGGYSFYGVDYANKKIFKYDSNMIEMKYIYDANGIATVFSEMGFIYYIDNNYNLNKLDSNFILISSIAIPNVWFGYAKDYTMLNSTGIYTAFNNTNFLYDLEQVDYYGAFVGDIGTRIYTDLTGDIDNSVTTIPVTSTTGFETTGQVFIGVEKIAYTGITSTSFTGCTRAIYPTSASAHSTGDYVAVDRNIALNDTHYYKFTPRGKTIEKHDLTGSLISTYTTAFQIQCMDCDSDNLYIYDYVSSGTHSIYKYSPSMVLKASRNIGFSYVGVHSNMATEGWYNSGFFYLISGNYVCVFNGNLNLILERDMGYALYGFTIAPFDFTEWADLCAPCKPIQQETASAGSITGTPVMSYRYTGYNPDSLAETSGGTISPIQTSTGKKNEVFFDFNLATQWTEGKCEDIGVTNWRLYRKDGTADFKLALSVPIYWEVAETLGDLVTDLTLKVSALKGMLVKPDGTASTENFYILLDDEILFVDGSTVTTTSWTVARAQKGTTIATHDAAKFAYIFSIIDDIPTASLGTVAPINNDYVDNCKMMTSHNGRFWMANSPENPSRVWYSSVNPDTGTADEDIISETSYFDINKNDGDEITAIYPYLGNLLVFKNRSSYYIYGDGENASVMPWKETVGCVSGKTIVEIGNNLVYLSYEGLMLCSGLTITCISKKIKNFILGINWNYAYKAVAERNPEFNEIWFAVPYSTSTINNRVIVFKTTISDFKEDNSFMIWTRDISCLQLFDYDSSFQSATANMLYLFSGDSTGSINQENIGVLDNTTAITSTFTTKRFNFEYDNNKKFKRLILDFEGQGSNAYTISYQYGTNKTAIGTANTINTGGSGFTSEKTYIKEYLVNPENPEGNYIYFVFTNSTISQLMQIYNISIDYKSGKVR